MMSVFLLLFANLFPVFLRHCHTISPKTCTQKRLLHVSSIQTSIENLSIHAPYSEEAKRRFRAIVPRNEAVTVSPALAEGDHPS